MKPTLFVSDVHLSAERPQIVDTFVAFLCGPARRARQLYLLGDCFDRYLGDDDTTPPHPQIVDALAALVGAGVPVRFMRGNHDFLIGGDFARRTGCKLLPDESLIEMGETRALVMHGDTLCTDDTDYQAFRVYSRDPANQHAFLNRPLAERIVEAERLRHESRQATRLKPDDIMDANQGAIRDVMRKHAVNILIHGHTHRPAVHEFELDGRAARRFVLGDWYEQDSVLVWDDEGLRLGPLHDAIA